MLNPPKSREKVAYSWIAANNANLQWHIFYWIDVLSAEIDIDMKKKMKYDWSKETKMDKTMSKGWNSDASKVRFVVRSTKQFINLAFLFTTMVITVHYDNNKLT